MADSYGWSIEYIMNLSLPQIKSLMSGREEIYKIQEKETEKSNSKPSAESNKDSKKPEVNDMATLISAMGGSVKMTPRAKEKMMKIIGKKEKVT